jgi:Fur family transcriptional regulator, peroxide stress response regulator
MARKDEAVDGRLAAFVGLCRRAGLKATHQRLEIFRDLAGTAEHPGAEAVYRRVKARIPALSLDTVYRTLRLLEARGVIARVASAGDRARFDANTEPHCHFVCRRCGRVLDFFDEDLGELAAPAGAAALGAVESVRVELQGVCRDCQAAGRGAGRGRPRA